ncbi:hypothetical protein ES703_52640 [subsurface metagenome]
MRGCKRSEVVLLNVLINVVLGLHIGDRASGDDSDARVLPVDQRIRLQRHVVISILHTGHRAYSVVITIIGVELVWRAETISALNDCDRLVVGVRVGRPEVDLLDVLVDAVVVASAFVRSSRLYHAHARIPVNQRRRLGPNVVVHLLRQARRGHAPRYVIPILHHLARVEGLRGEAPLSIINSSTHVL